MFSTSRSSSTRRTARNSAENAVDGPYGSSSPQTFRTSPATRGRVSGEKLPLSRPSNKYSPSPVKSGTKTVPLASPAATAAVSATATVSVVDLKAASERINRLLKRKSSYESTWEPPISCQRTSITRPHKASLTHYFPLELTTSEYFQRILRVITNCIHHSVQKLTTSGRFLDLPDNLDNLGFSFSSYSRDNYDADRGTEPGYIVEKFLRILHCESVLLADRRSAVHLFVNSWDNNSEFLSSTETLLKFHEEFLMADYGYSKLGDLSAAFSAAKIMVSCFNRVVGNDQDQLQNNLASSTIFSMSSAVAETPTKNKIASKVSGEVLTAVDALHDLEEQMNMHRTFKQSRMAALGWIWGPEDLEVDNVLMSRFSDDHLSAFMPKDTSSDQFLMLDSAAEVRDAAMKKYEELKKEVMVLLDPTCMARTALVNRLVGLVEDLTSLVLTVTEDADYSEAQRLRQLCQAVDSTIDQECRQLYDRAALTSSQCTALCDELLRASRLIADANNEDPLLDSRSNYDSAILLDDLANELTRLGHLLKMQVKGYSILASPEVLHRLEMEGSKFINADFLFRFSTGSGEPAISALIISARSTTLFNAIANWPDFQSSSLPAVPVSFPTTGMKPTPNTDLTISVSSPTSKSLNGSSRLNRSVGSRLSPKSVGSDNKGSGAGFFSPGSGDRFTRSSISPTAKNMSTFEKTLESYNRIGFSPVILKILQSYEELQMQLQRLKQPHSLALTALLCRLIGLKNDLMALSEVNTKSGQYSESDRLLKLSGILEDTIDADIQEESEGVQASANTTINNFPAKDESSGIVCGRGRRRIDNVKIVIEETHDGIRQLHRLAVTSRAQIDYTGAAALEALAAELEESISVVEQSIEPFSILDSDNDSAPVFEMSFNSNSSKMESVVNNIEINERIAREGTSFVTSDYLFQYSTARLGTEGHSISSLALVAGAGAILRHIRRHWPGLTALTSSSRPPASPRRSALLASRSMDMGDERKMSLSRLSMDTIDSDYQSSAPVNFKSVNELRLLGFDPLSLKAAGFSDVDILTGGFKAAELKQAGFTTETMRQIGLTDNAIRVVGYREEQQIDVLLDLYYETGGSLHWKQSGGWNALVSQIELDRLNASSDKVGINYRPRSQKLLLGSLFGVHYEVDSGNVVIVALPGNGLKGPLLDTIGSLTSLTQLVLSENHLKGNIPNTIGLLVNLESLILNDNELYGEIPKSLKSLHNLTILRLENNYLEGLLPPSLTYLSKLRRLDVSNNRLSGVIPNRIGNLVSLQELLLHTNEFTGSVPESIGKLSNLTSLLLFSNNLSGAIPLSMGKLGRLTSLNLRDNDGISVDRIQLQRALPKCNIKL